MLGLIIDLEIKINYKIFSKKIYNNFCNYIGKGKIF